MSAPYWGELPQPRGIQDRRLSQDANEYSNREQRYSLDNQPQRKGNRASVQTTYTDAPTETTFSPQSPTASALLPEGLAPRPPSYQQGSKELASDGHDRRRSRSNRVSDYEDLAVLPPAAPDIPRAPPLSYRDPYSNGAYSYSNPSPASSRPPQQPVPAEGMATDEYFPPQHRDSLSGPPHQIVDDGLSRRDSTAAAPPRRDSASGPQDRRKKLAVDRSPLQRLELTLDSMTKEEKRARVEAAEQRARARAAKKAASQAAAEQAQAHLQQPAPPQERQLPAPLEPAAPTAPTAPTTLPTAPKPIQNRESIPQRNSSAPQAPIQRQRPQEQYHTREQDDGRPERTFSEQRKSLPPQRLPEDHYHAHLQNNAIPSRTMSEQRRAPPPQQMYDARRHYYGQDGPQPPRPMGEEPPAAAVQEFGPPKRNLSFRERAARDEVNPSSQEAIPPVNQPTKATNNGISLTRSGSNKLKKKPPADIWHQKRLEAEQRLPTSKSSPYVENATVPRSLAQMPQQVRSKELPPLPLATAEQMTPPVGRGGIPASAMGPNNRGVQRRATEPGFAPEHRHENEFNQPTAIDKTTNEAEQSPQPAHPNTGVEEQDLVEHDDHDSFDQAEYPQESRMVFMEPGEMRPGDGLYKPPQWLEEWMKGTVGTLSGALLDLSTEQLPSATSEKNSAWWEREGGGGHRRNTSVTSRPRKAEAFAGEYDDTSGAPTRFKPPLHLKCGPLLRYCGLRQEAVPTKSRGGSAVQDREMWRGSIMIVTTDADSSYEIAPMLRLFVQDIELLPPPPQHVNGELSPEHVDPIAGHPKLGRRGETLYVRPVEHLEESKDLSVDETESGLFEKTRSPPDEPLPDGLTDYPGSYASRRRRVDIDGEKMQKYKDVRGFRLHAEQGCTFWRFNIEVELREQQQRIAYRINRGPAMAFWVPASGQTMNMMFYTCNGFSASVKPDELSGPDPMWRDVLNSHQSKPFHVMIGGGDQIYNDRAAYECDLFDEWLDLRNPQEKHSAGFMPEMQSQLEHFYLERYCRWFSSGMFGLANSQIPMVNMYDDHDIFDGYGSYPDDAMSSPVFSGLGAVGFKYYMLFQHQSVVTETENSEPSWILGEQPGPYIKELSRSLYMSMGGKVALLAVDARTERTEKSVLNDKTWEKITNRMYAEIRRGQVEHLLVLLTVPIAYPRLVWLENMLTSRFMGPVKLLSRAGLLGKTGKALNNIDGGFEILDDLNDHWTAKNHKKERSVIIEDLQDLAIDRSVRVTMLSGDVHLAAVGQFYSNSKLGLPKHKDPRYMPNIISSAIVNTPPPDMMADILNRRNKVHHFDKQTDEAMIPIFHHGVNGKPRNNKTLLPHRNWCSIQMWTPGNTPPPTPPGSDRGRSRSPSNGSGGGGFFRRLSSRRRSSSKQPFDPSRESVRGPRPPISSGGGLFRSLSRRNSVDKQRPSLLARSLSLGRGESQQRSGMMRFARPGGQPQYDDAGINDQWGSEYDDDDYMDHRIQHQPRPSGLRGGAGSFEEFSEGDEAYFTAQAPRRSQNISNQALPPNQEMEGPPVRPFHRTPTGLSIKKMKEAEKHVVNLEGGLDICLNVEVNCKDPTGITVPYRILVPRLEYEYSSKDDLSQPAAPTGIKKLLSFRKKPQQPQPQQMEENEDDFDDTDDDDRYRRQ